MVKRKRTSRKGPKSRSFKRRRMVNYRAPRPQRRLFGAKSARQKLQYNDSLTFTGGVGVSKYAFRANSCFDPDTTGVGHQPHYFDQCMQFYDHYTVLGAKITIQGETNLNNEAMIVSIRTSDTNNTLASGNDVMENKRSHYIYVPSSSTNTSTKYKISHKVSIPKFFGKSVNSLVNSDQYRGTVSSNPLEDVYFIVEFFAADGGSSLTGDNFVVTLQQYVSLNEPKTIAGS